MANNTLKFFGVPLGKEPVQDANTIWAFHFGILKNTVTNKKGVKTEGGWFSEKLNNFEELIWKVNEKKVSERKLLLAIPTYGNYEVNFNLYKGLKAERLCITVYDGKIFLAIITFFNITVNDRTPYATKVAKAGYQLHDIAIGGNISVDRINPEN